MLDSWIANNASGEIGPTQLAQLEEQTVALSMAESDVKSASVEVSRLKPSYMMR